VTDRAFGVGKTVQISLSVERYEEGLTNFLQENIKIRII
jgi:hypothetical protein